MPMKCLSREEFLEKWDFDAEREFELDNNPARWAEGTSGPQFWGEESGSITLKRPVDDEKSERYLDGDLALSPDERYLAVSLDRVIYIYRTDSRTLCAELVGHLGPVRMLCFSSYYNQLEYLSDRRDRYLLLSQADGVDRCRREGDIISWQLDADGRQVLDHRAMPFASEHMADKAIGSIAEDLHTHHELSTDEVLSIRQSIADALKVADIKNRAQYLSKAEGMHWTGSYLQSGPFSHDGKHMVVVTTPTTTLSEGGNAKPRSDSTAVILDSETLEEKCRLEGHTDNIIWVDWSRDGSTGLFAADDKAIATASWDGTYKIWDPATGECRHTIGPTDRQNWVGHFSPDGVNVLFSGTGTAGHVNIYRTATAERVATLPAPQGGKLADWIRKISWHPRNHGIVLENDQSVLFWDWVNGNVQELFKLREHEEPMLSRFACVTDLCWIEQGRKLLVQWSDGTLCIWDKEENVKWRIQRPKGAPGGFMSPKVLYLMHQRTILSLDGDRKVRYWRL